MGKVQYRLDNQSIETKDLKNYKYLGKGHSGKVYLMPDGRVIKIFKDNKTCRDEYNIYKAVERSHHFPKVHEIGDHCIIREFVSGINLSDYLNPITLDHKFVRRIVNLTEELKSLGFKKIDMRFPHIFVQTNGDLMLIDPRESFKTYTPYPKSFIIDLKEIGLYDRFIKILREERPDINWS